MSQSAKRTLRHLAPYLAVLVFWCMLSNAWLAILAYHAQVLFWARGRIPKTLWQGKRRLILLALPTVLAGPVLYFLLPYITQVDLAMWLEDHHLSRVSFLLMIPYFGILHPILEQIHWAPLREETPVSHVLFAGYHMLVLHSLLTIPWLLLCFVVLTSASIIWKQMVQRSNSLLTPIASHVLADLGVILAALAQTSG